jgi:chromosome segregation ATPase
VIQKNSAMTSETTAVCQAVLRAKGRNQSFRDLQRAASFLGAKAEAAEERSSDLNCEVEGLRERNRRDLAALAVLTQDLESRAAMARELEFSSKQESLRAHNAEVECARLNERLILVEGQLAASEKREVHLLEEINGARENTAQLHAVGSAQRAQSSNLQSRLTELEAEREQMLGEMSSMKHQLDSSYAELTRCSNALQMAREEAAALREQVSEATRALHAARSSNKGLAERVAQCDGMIKQISTRGQEAALEAMREAEARVAAERAAFSLRERNNQIQRHCHSLMQQLGARSQAFH